VTRPSSALVDSFAGLDVVVLGDAMLDTYLEGTSSRLCQEGPVPIVDIDRRRDLPGGAANVAANLAALGARASLLSVVGGDREGELVVAELEGSGVATGGLVTAPERQTLARQRIVSGSQLVVRFDQGTTTPTSTAVSEELAARLATAFMRAQAIVVSDYGYGVVPPAVVALLKDLQADAPRVVVVDAKDLGAYRSVGITAAKPNYAQVARLLGRFPATGMQRVTDVTLAAEDLLEATGAQVVAVTLDRDGAVVLERGRPAHRTFAVGAPDARAAGAGDSYVSALALALASGAHVPAAAEIAAATAAVVVSKAVTATCSAAELRAMLSLASHKCLRDRASLDRSVEALRREGKRLVFTNGCFDLLHRGHITYLNRAKLLGDVLVVGVNTDAGVARLKGPQRPVNPLDDRMEVLAGLSSVDLVVSFDEDTPERLIELIRPDVFVKGGDYSVEMLPEARVVEAHGGAVAILDYVEDTSTTGILERVRGSPKKARATS
jgi:D-beta-D-heptose 7-phosphate kinase / D-beta-D-heptose 1-phosphate adenosyltransferase